jgi:hypothetical protein
MAVTIGSPWTHIGTDNISEQQFYINMKTFKVNKIEQYVEFELLVDNRKQATEEPYAVSYVHRAYCLGSILLTLKESRYSQIMHRYEWLEYTLPKQAQIQSRSIIEFLCDDVLVKKVLLF